MPRVEIESSRVRELKLLGEAVGVDLRSGEHIMSRVRELKLTCAPQAGQVFPFVVRIKIPAKSAGTVCPASGN